MDEQDNKVVTITEEEKTFTEEEVMQAIEQLSNSGAMNYGYEDTFMELSRTPVTLVMG